MNQRCHSAARHRQRGSVLLVSVVILALLTLIVISAVKLTNVNTKVAGNMQLQKEAEAASTLEIERVISADFTAAPVASTNTVDVNHDGAPDFTVTVAVPQCLSNKPIKNTELEVTIPDDLRCLTSGSSQNTGLATGTNNGNSLCANSLWDIESTATDLNGSEATAVTHQGIATRVITGTNCP